MQALIISGKNIVTDVGKIKIVDACKNKGMMKAKVEINTSETELGEAELKVYDPSLDRKKGATIEIRKLSDSEYEFVEKLRDVITCLLDKFLCEDEEKPASKACVGSSGKVKYLVCDVCDWQTRFEAALKGHKKRMHEKKGISEEVSCDLCPFSSSSKATLMVHKRIKHKDESNKRSKDVFKCDECHSTFESEETLSGHMKTQHAISGNSRKPEVVSPSSSPPRQLVEVQEEMLDLDSMEINVEKELSKNFLLQKRIEELEIVVQNLLDEKAKDEEIKNELKVTIEELRQMPEIKLPRHLSSVHTAHLPLLKGFKMLYKTLGNGRCLENSIAVHIFENEDEGINVKKMINNHIADNFENYYHNIINLPYKEVIMEEGHTKVIEKKTKEEFIEFLRSEELLTAFSNCQELVAVANVFNIKIHIFEYRGKDGRWSEIHPDPDMTSTATMVGSWAPELFLYNNSNTHYDLLVRDDSRLVDGLVGKVIENEANEGWKTVPSKKHKKGVTFISGEKLLTEERNGNESDIELEEALTLGRGKEHGYRPGWENHGEPGNQVPTKS